VLGISAPQAQVCRLTAVPEHPLLKFEAFKFTYGMLHNFVTSCSVLTLPKKTSISKKHEISLSRSSSFISCPWCYIHICKYGKTWLIRNARSQKKFSEL
jgi:hypothetical protein